MLEITDFSIFSSLQCHKRFLSITIFQPTYIFEEGKYSYKSVQRTAQGLEPMLLSPDSLIL
jgi:hypothetical protein